jgi:hypothetical protein
LNLTPHSRTAFESTIQRQQFQHSTHRPKEHTERRKGGMTKAENEQTAAGQQTHFLEKSLSGAMQILVPLREFSWRTDVERLKSAIFRLLFLVNSRFSGFRSQWTTEATSHKYSTPGKTTN